MRMNITSGLIFTNRPVIKETLNSSLMEMLFAKALHILNSDYFRYVTCDKCESHDGKI